MNNFLQFIQNTCVFKFTFTLTGAPSTSFVNNTNMSIGKEDYSDDDIENLIDINNLDMYMIDDSTCEETLGMRVYIQ